MCAFSLPARSDRAASAAGGQRRERAGRLAGAWRVRRPPAGQSTRAGAERAGGAEPGRAARFQNRAAILIFIDCGGVAWRERWRAQSVMEVQDWAAAHLDEARNIEIVDHPRLLGARDGGELVGKTHSRAVLVGRGDARRNSPRASHIGRARRARRRTSSDRLGLAVCAGGRERAELACGKEAWLYGRGAPV